MVDGLLAFDLAFLVLNNFSKLCSKGSAVSSAFESVGFSSSSSVSIMLLLINKLSKMLGFSSTIFFSFSFSLSSSDGTWLKKDPDGLFAFNSVLMDDIGKSANALVEVNDTDRSASSEILLELSAIFQRSFRLSNCSFSLVKC